MPPKKNYSLTSRYFAETKPFAVGHSALPILLNNRPFRRLAFGEPLEKMRIASWEFVDRIRTFFAENAIFFPDTNFFTKAINPAVWDALLRKRIAIPPLIRQELEPWLKEPFHNPRVRNVVLDAIQHAGANWLRRLDVFDPRATQRERVVFPELNEHFLDFA